MKPRPFTPAERAAWLPVLAEFSHACTQGAQAIADAMTRLKPDLDTALAVAGECRPADVEGLDAEGYINALASLMQVNAKALTTEVRPNGRD